MTLLTLLALCIHPHGFWEGEEALHDHKYDAPLSQAIATFFAEEGAHSLVDFGCGMGDYTKALEAHGFSCEAYDGNPATPLLTAGLGKTLDLAEPFDLHKRFDWVLCLEVGEHIPKAHETTLLENLIRHSEKGILLSWALPGQGGVGHVNEEENRYIEERLTSYGYDRDLIAEEKLRAAASWWWFRNTVMVFRRN
ncbi:MAG: methyltransferase domain-containing protein [Verrucomicrobia bacterium]|nr:methyltransferase domain-containing protein [Verrucomicrobiota bacterium]